MSEMVERVARALNAKRTVPRPEWQEWVPFARAAIAAMKEPTEAMVHAGDHTPTDHAWSGDGEFAASAGIYRAMIGAALS